MGGGEAEDAVASQEIDQAEKGGKEIEGLDF